MKDSRTGRKVPKRQDSQLPIHESYGFLLREIGRAIGRYMEPRIASHGLSVPMWFLLRILAEEEGITQREISNRLKIMEASAMQTLREMDERGLITRTRSEIDRRKVHLALSEAGKKLLAELMPIAVELQAHLSQCGTPEELAVFHRVLLRVRTVLGETEGGPVASD
jgi:MarR family transcriptional regulator for hemolysin